MIDHVLVLRGIACLAVVLDHLQPFPYVPFGFASVWLFFMLSSFLLTKGFLVSRFSSPFLFYASRARRLLPAMAFVQIAVVCLTYYGFREASPYRAVDWAREISILVAAPWAPYLNVIESANSPIWSVILEIHFIVLLPFLVRFPRSVAVLCIAWFAAIPALPTLYPDLYASHVFNVGFFLLGILAAFVKQNVRVSWTFVYVAALAWTVVECGARLLDVESALRYGPFFLGPAFFLLLLAINTDYQKPLPTTYKSLVPRSPLGILEVVGAISYSLYLSHKFVGLNFGLLAVTVVAIILYIEIESRFWRRGAGKQTAPFSLPRASTPNR